jgi:hypothetical protein
LNAGSLQSVFNVIYFEGLHDGGDELHRDQSSCRFKRLMS